MNSFRTSTFIIALTALAAGFVACAPDDDVDENDENADSTAEDLSSTSARVCSWNIRRLGNNFQNEPKDMSAVAKVIRDNCDLVAIEETMVTIAQSGTNSGGYDALLSALGTRYWGGVITESAVPAPVTSNSEYYSFIFRKSAVSACPNSKVQRLPDPKDVFIREPAWGCFKLKSQPRELVVAAYHALFGAPNARKIEVGFIDDDLDGNGKRDDLFNAMKASRPGDPDVLLLGDFNLGSKELAEALPNYVDLASGKGSTINLSDDITTNQYDHALVPKDSRLLGHVSAAETLDVRKVAKPGAKYYSTVSDHLPIRLTIK